jgi:hypothetical protein
MNYRPDTHVIHEGGLMNAKTKLRASIWRL